MHPPAPHLVALPDGQRLTAPQALQAAMALHQAGRLRKAAELYRCVLVVEPRHADALHLLGLTERQLGHLPQAIELMRAAIAANPLVAMFHSNLGQALCAQGLVTEAEAACRHALELNPLVPEAHLNLANALSAQQRTDAAVESFDKALRLRPNYIDALLGQGDALQAVGRHVEALASYQRVLELQPDSMAGLTRMGISLRLQGRVDDAITHYEVAIQRFPDIPELHNNLSLLYQRIGRMDAAAASQRRLVALTPDDATAWHMLNALEGKTTERAPADYVRNTFDDYAENFELHLVQKLGYHIPEQLAQLVKQHWGEAAAGQAALDMGCGTGLFGAAIADACRRLVGIDIAPKMVDKAREKGIYTELAVADILVYLQSCAAASFDLVAATDVFIYVGKLTEIFRETARVLRPGGLFAFSVESAPEDGADFVLDTTGRYRQSVAYLRRLAKMHQLRPQLIEPAIIRHQQEQPVDGYVCLFVSS